MELNEPDRTKYWQYKLKERGKVPKNNEGKGKQHKVRTP